MRMRLIKMDVRDAPQAGLSEQQPHSRECHPPSPLGRGRAEGAWM
jgi:hypothetical protein